jgi:hypothetical protein
MPLSFCVWRYSCLGTAVALAQLCTGLASAGCGTSSGNGSSGPQSDAAAESGVSSESGTDASGPQTDAPADSGTVTTPPADAGCGEAGARTFVPGSAACTNDVPLLVGDAGTGYSTCNPTPKSAGTGTIHRASVVRCPNLLVAAAAGSCTDVSGTCKSNADCAAVGPNAACTMSGAIAGYCECRAGCVSDSDCKAGEVCLCNAPIGGCVPASCTSDAQCGPGLLCAMSPNDPSRTCGVGVATFACQTMQDTCLVDSDCSGCNVTASCGIDGNGHRVCSMPCPIHVGP